MAVTILVALAGCTVEATGPTGDFGGDDPADVTSIAAGPALVWPRVASGDLNQDVTTLQYLLTAAGKPVELNGRFGATTDVAVRAIQQANGMVVDGIVGEQTWLVLLVEIDAGDSGAAVSAAQYLLKNRYGANLDVTAIFGTTTEARVEAFQSSKCLEATGVVGRYTWNALIARRNFCGGGGGGSGAQRVLAAHQAGTLTLWNQTFGRFDGADPLSNITDAAAGRAARTSCYGGAPCSTVRLSNGLVNGMAGLREQYGYRYFVTAVAGASHSSGSYHYAGRAFDTDEINGVQITGDSARNRAFMAACRSLGAIEVLGPSNDPGHRDHIHCAW